MSRVVAVRGPYWRADRREYHVHWRWSGLPLSESVGAAHGVEDQATAERIAQRVKEFIQSAASPGDKAAARTYRDHCIAEEVAAASTEVQAALSIYS